MHPDLIREIRGGVDGWRDQLTGRWLPAIAGADPATDAIREIRQSLTTFEAEAWRVDNASHRDAREPIRRARQILDRCDTEGRLPRPDESSELSRFAGQARELLGPRAGERHGYQPHDGETFGNPHRSRPELRNQHILTRDQRLYDWTRERGRGSDWNEDDAAGFSLGRAIAGMVTGNWSDAELERRAMSEGVNADGGFAVPEILASSVIDRVRNVGQVLNAGATIVPVLSDQHSIPRMASGITPAWKNENAAVNENAPTFERVTFAVKTLPHLVRMSEELFEDITPASQQIIEQEIIAALALELDRVALRGSGTAPEPRGVRNQTGVEIISLGANGATPTNWSLLVNAVAGVQSDNIQPSHAIYSSRTAKTFAGFADNTGQPLRRPQLLDSLTDLISNQIPNNLTIGTSVDCSELYVGLWSQLLIGVRPSVGVRVKILQERFADNLQVGILCWLRADIQLAHPEAFTVTTGVRP